MAYEKTLIQVSVDDVIANIGQFLNCENCGDIVIHDAASCSACGKTNFIQLDEEKTIESLKSFAGYKIITVGIS